MWSETWVDLYILYSCDIRQKTVLVESFLLQAKSSIYNLNKVFVDFSVPLALIKSSAQKYNYELKNVRVFSINSSLNFPYSSPTSSTSFALHKNYHLFYTRQSEWSIIWLEKLATQQAIKSINWRPTIATATPTPTLWSCNNNNCKW